MSRLSVGDGAVIDLNADVGESFGRWTLGDDQALLPHLTSANVACGFHAGDPTTLRRTCELAVEHGVSIGAQVGYRDLAGFGRREIDIDAADLEADVLYQLGALDALARAAGAAVRYVKPHGALYHAVNRREHQARAVLGAVISFGRSRGEPLPVLGLPGSPFLRAATEAGVPVVGEGFADRAYRADGSLRPRSEPGALLSDPAQVAAQAVSLARAGSVRSVCLHGDTPGAAVAAAAVRTALAAAGIVVEPFVTP